VKSYLIYLACFALLGGSFGYLLKNKSSYVLLTYETYALESSLWFFIFALIVLYFIVNFSLAILLKFWRPGHRFTTWASRRNI